MILNKKIFGILHVTEILLNVAYNVPICVHTKYGNLYVIKKSKHNFEHCNIACNNCCMDGFCDSSCCCIMRFIDKYKKNNLKVLRNITSDKIKDMEIKYPNIDWKAFFEKKIEVNINRNDLKV